MSKFRIVLTAEDFKALVHGYEICKDEVGLILEDIGFEKMKSLILKAEINTRGGSGGSGGSGKAEGVIIYSARNLPKHIVRHSPDGMNWGYSGSGPSDLALSLLNETVGLLLAEKYYMDFKFEFVACWGDDWEISEMKIHQWVKDKEKKSLDLIKILA